AKFSASSLAARSGPSQNQSPPPMSAATVTPDTAKIARLRTVLSFRGPPFGPSLLACAPSCFRRRPGRPIPPARLSRSAYCRDRLYQADWHGMNWKRALGIPAAAIGALAIRDITQRHHALLRNFPVIGHGRY